MHDVANWETEMKQKLLEIKMWIPILFSESFFPILAVAALSFWFFQNYSNQKLDKSSKKTFASIDSKVSIESSEFLETNLESFEKSHYWRKSNVDVVVVWKQEIAF